jgi:hypothetical protein
VSEAENPRALREALDKIDKLTRALEYWKSAFKALQEDYDDLNRELDVIYSELEE